jgi:hypothetical protein
LSLFDGFNDSPNHIKTEGQTMTAIYSPGVPAIGQATVSWSIPNAAQGCGAAEDGRGAYCGVVVTLHTEPVQYAQAPTDGTYYVNDPTADPDKHTGDAIGGALVVGAFYEGEKRARNEELTTSLIIQDIASNTPYFITVYAVDCQGRYHTDGIRTYSSDYGNPDQPGSPASQVVQMMAGNGVQATDGTNLIPGVIYEFDVEVNTGFPTSGGNPNDVINIKIDGTDAQTYEDLLREINAQVAQSNNPVSSPVPPNTGSYYINPTTAKLSQFNGSSYVAVDALFELDDPVAQDDDYWFNPDTVDLQQYDGPSTTWNAIPTITYPEDPASPQCDAYWFNGTQGYKYNGSAWCPVDTEINTEDPADATGGSCGLFWYSDEFGLQEWDENEASFDPRSAITYPEDPRNLTIGTYWFNDVTNFLYVWDGTQFQIEPNFVITSNTPQVVSNASAPPATDPSGTSYRENVAPGLLWYDPEHETLRISVQFSNTMNWFVDVHEQTLIPPLLAPGFIVWDEDPSTTEACELWWDTTNDLLMNWDVVIGAWVEVVEFVQQDANPTIAPVVEVGTLWYEPTEKSVSYWDGVSWTNIPYINYVTDPRSLPLGVAWLDATTGDIAVSDGASGWTSVDPTDTTIDPALIPQGAFWYDLTNNVLNTRVGAGWVPVPFTSSPIVNVKGAQWYDSTNGLLMEWSGSMWVEAVPVLEFGLTAEGNIAMQSSARGSCTSIMFLVPGAQQNTPGVRQGTGFADFHSASHYDSYTSGPFTAPPIANTNVTEEGFLFNHLPGQILPQTYGTDGLQGTSMYDIVGVGTDGTPDERRELADSLRAQLGHPVIEVELTDYQIDTAITGAIESLRKRSDIAYERGFYFLDVGHGHQVYSLTNKCAGFDKIVGVMGVHRMTGAFAGAGGHGIYGQVVMQHLYNMGSYDLTSFHLVAQYVETMEMLFATRITYHWNETSRKLSLHQSFHRPERLLMDCYVERKEQDLLRDRWCKSWIEKYALSLCRITLSEIRGKFATLPGAGGGVSLNASDLAARADADIEELYQQLDDYVTSHVENFGLGTQFTIG